MPNIIFYPIALDLTEKTYTYRSASYFDLQLNIDTERGG